VPDNDPPTNAPLDDPAAADAADAASAKRNGRYFDSSDELAAEMTVFGDPDRLHIHSTAKVNDALFNLSSGHVRVGKFAFFGHRVSVLTGSHDVTKFGEERQNAIASDGHDVDIGDGVWVASHAIIVGPCTIGDHAVVGVASVVLGDVEPYTVVAGHPAKAIKVIDHPEGL
jgi:acetyltransferase-like isoleucine patch superfamily enzyme